MPPTDNLTDDLDADAIEAGRLLFARECTFVMGVAKPEQIPATSLPEVERSCAENEWG